MNDFVVELVAQHLFNPVGFQSLGYKEQKNVMTTVELNRIMKEERFEELLADIETPKIAFIQCIGSRNRELGRDYCSQVCCKISARQANKIHFLRPDAKISIFHKDFQVVGKEFRQQMKKMKQYVEFIQGVPAEIFAEHKKSDRDQTGSTGDLLICTCPMGEVRTEDP